MSILKIPLKHIAGDELRLRYIEAVCATGYGSAESALIAQELDRRLRPAACTQMADIFRNDSAWRGVNRRCGVDRRAPR